MKNTSLVMENTNVLKQGMQNSSNIKEGDNMCKKQENNSSSNDHFISWITKQLQETISSKQGAFTNDSRMEDKSKFENQNIIKYEKHIEDIAKICMSLLSKTMFRFPICVEPLLHILKPFLLYLKIWT